MHISQLFDVFYSTVYPIADNPNKLRLMLLLCTATPCSEAVAGNAPECDPLDRLGGVCTVACQTFVSVNWVLRSAATAVPFSFLETACRRGGVVKDAISAIPHVQVDPGAVSRKTTIDCLRKGDGISINTVVSL